MIYLAPLQGFTDYIYRAAYAKVFNLVDAFYIPYISLKNDTIPQKYMREIHPENNKKGRVIPQILAKDAKEIELLCRQLESVGYDEINLNLGCPYPMVSKRGRGSGLLPFPDEIYKLLDHFHNHSKAKLSVKLRAGLKSADELSGVIDVLNQFPLTSVILHARVASQLYSGQINEDAFSYAEQHLKHKLVYNGDIFSGQDYLQKQNKFKSIETWMLGRGILMNPFLPNEIRGTTIRGNERAALLHTFHETMLEQYLETMDNQGNALNKIKQFWIYFSHCFPEQKKTLKHLKKAKTLNKYKEVVRSAFYSLSG